MRVKAASDRAGLVDVEADNAKVIAPTVNEGAGGAVAAVAGVARNRACSVVRWAWSVGDFSNPSG